MTMSKQIAEFIINKPITEGINILLAAGAKISQQDSTAVFTIDTFTFTATQKKQLQYTK